MLSRRKLAAHVPVIAALFILGALAPLALADNGGNPNGGSGGGKSGTSSSSTTTTTTTASTTTTTTTSASSTTTTTSASSTSGKGGKGGKSGSTQSSSVPPLALVSEYVQNSPNPAAPTWCLNEDDFDQRVFSGSLSGSFSTSFDLCDPSVDYSGGLWWDAGGIGLQADLYVVGTLSDLVIVSPTGDAHHAVLVSSTTSQGVTTQHYQVCYVPPYSISTNVGGTPLTGGTWQVTLSGQISSASWTTRAHMTDATFQQANCPTSEQNLVP
jgi:hypothetical protein